MNKNSNATFTRNGAYNLDDCNAISVGEEDIVTLLSDNWNIQSAIFYPFGALSEEITELNIKIVKKEK